MIYDPIEVGVKFLRSRITDVPVAASLVGHKTGRPRLVVHLTGGGRSIRDRLDLVTIDVDAYGPDKGAALALAMRARAALLRDGPGWSDGTVVFADVTEELFPTDLEDTVSSEQRFVFSASIYVYLRRAFV
ncbi:hypothetical protein GCM10010466_29320 [Planomonospora alba]|uniref:Tail terminator n=1 Tax=Planomonospora alba TaxID=161354 RepID=A0ABP6N793_9ACTN